MWKNTFFIRRYITIPENKRKLVASIIIMNFVVRLLIFFNTQSFQNISESKSIFTGLENLNQGQAVELFSAAFVFALSYVAYFINNIFFSDIAIFIFQCFIGAFTDYLIYRIILLITADYKASLVGLFLLTIYIENLLLSSILYNQLFDLFFTSLFLYVSLQLIKNMYLRFAIVYALILASIVFTSLFFRSTLLFSFLIFMCFLVVLTLILKKDLHRQSYFNILSVIIFLVSVTFLYNPAKLFRSDGDIVPNDFNFLGHTLYGGGRGEGSFIEPKYEIMYKEKLADYLKINKITIADRKVLNDFQSDEIKKFIFNHPFDWVVLQVRKVAYTYGVIPQKDGITMLTKGKVSIHWSIASILMILPFVLIIIGMIYLLDKRTILAICKDKMMLFLVLFGLYLMAGISLYGHYQERYRPAVVCLFFIPLITYSLSKTDYTQLFKNKKLNIGIISVIILFWVYQLYEAVFLMHDRYFKNL